MLDIWEIDINTRNIEIAQCYTNILSDVELCNTNRFKFFKDYSRYLVAHVAMRLLLAKYSNIKPNAIIYRYGKYGKPYFSDNIFFNLSHSYKKIIIGFCKKEIGIDIEHKKDVEYDEISKILFTENERIYINSGDKRERFYELWTKKEAFVKAMGTGLSEDMKNLSLVAKNSYSDKNQTWQITKIKSNSNYAAHVVYEHDKVIYNLNYVVLDFNKVKPF